MAVQRRRMSLDPVKEQGKLVSQVMKERISSTEWEKNWGFMRDKNKFLEEEAAKIGWTKEEFWEAVHSVYAKKTTNNSVKNELSDGPFEFPKTTNGMYGWRKSSDLSMQNQLMVSKVKKFPSQNVIFLG